MNDLVRKASRLFGDIDVICENCGQLYEPKVVSHPELHTWLCGDCDHLIGDREYWARRLHMLLEDRGTLNARIAICEGQLARLCPEAQPGETLRVGAFVVTPKRTRRIRIYEAMTWLGAYHPEAFETLTQEHTRIFVDPATEPGPQGEDYVPF